MVRNVRYNLFHLPFVSAFSFGRSQYADEQRDAGERREYKGHGDCDAEGLRPDEPPHGVKSGQNKGNEERPAAPRQAAP